MLTTDLSVVISRVFGARITASLMGSTGRSKRAEELAKYSLHRFHVANMFATSKGSVLPSTIPFILLWKFPD